MREKRLNRVFWYGLILVMWSLGIIATNLLNDIKKWEIGLACVSFCFGIYFIIKYLRLRNK